MVVEERVGQVVELVSLVVGETLEQTLAGVREERHVAEAAEVLKVKPSTVRQWVREGRLPCYRLGPRCTRFTRELLSRSPSSWGLGSERLPRGESRRRHSAGTTLTLSRPPSGSLPFRLLGDRLRRARHSGEGFRSPARQRRADSSGSGISHQLLLLGVEPGFLLCAPGIRLKLR